MNSEQLFSIALGLQHPWKVSALKFRENIEGGIELHIDIGFEKGGYFGDTDPRFGDIDPLNRLSFKEHDRLTILPFFS